MVSLVALTICVLVPTAAADSMDTCDSSDPSKCMSTAGTEEAAQGDVLLQGGLNRAKAKDVHEDLHEPKNAALQEEEEPHSQLEANFNEVDKHAKGLTDRLEVLLEHSKEQPLEQHVEQKVHDALALLQQARHEIYTVRGKHTSLLQSPTQDDKSRGALLQAMTHIQKIAREAEEVLSEIDDEDDVALLQEGEEDTDEEDEEDEDEEGGEEEQEEEDGEEEEEDDEEEDGEEDEEDKVHEDHDADMSEIQKGEGVQYEPEEEKDIERH